MSNGALRMDGERFVDLELGQEFSREDFIVQPYLAANQAELLRDGLGMPESSLSQLNEVIGGVFADVQEASFISQATLNAVPGYDASLPYRAASRGPIYPRGSTLSAQRLGATLYNTSADAVRKVIDLLDDDELKARASEIKGDNEDVIKSNQTIQFQTTAPYEGTMKNVGVLSKEAQELVELFGEGAVEIIQGLVQRVAESILTRADLSYGSLLYDTKNVTSSVAKGELKGSVDYSTLNPENFIKMMMRSLEFAVVGVVMGLPEARRDAILKQRKREAVG